MQRILLSLAGLVMVTGSAQADLCAWNSKATAKKALTYLKAGTIGQEYCQPCGDKMAVKVAVTSAATEVVDKDYDRVVINGKPVDLAYFYVKSPASSRTYSNLGLLVKCDMTEQDSPKSLPANLEGK